MEPVVFTHTGPPSSGGMRLNASRVITWAAGRGLLFLEDDITATSDLLVALDLAVAAGVPVTFFTHQPDPPITSPGLYPVEYVGWYGSQALYLPSRVVAAYAAWPSFGNGLAPAFDLHLVGTGLLRDLHAALPNPVQHRDPPSVQARSRPPMVSRSFGGQWHTSPTRT
jgi:hypothetical protein